MSAEGVTQGVSEAMTQLRKLNSVNEVIKLAIDSSELEKGKVSIKEVTELLKNMGKQPPESLEQAKAKVDILEKQAFGYKESIALLRDKRALDQITALEEIVWLERISEKYASNEKEKIDAEKRIYEARKKYNKKIFEEELAEIDSLNTGSIKTTDFAAKINAYGELIAKYAEDEEKLAVIGEKVASDLIARNKKIVDSNMERLNENISIIEREQEIAKKREGLLLGNGEKFQYSKDEEIAHAKQKIDLIELEIQKIEEKGNIASQYELDTLEKLYSMKQEYLKDIEDLEIDKEHEKTKKLLEILKEAKEEALEVVKQQIRKEQELKMKAIDDEIDIFKKGQNEKKKEIEKYYKDEISALNKQKESIIQGFKDRIEAIKSAVDLEIAQYKRRIEEIDEILKQDTRNDKDSSELKNIAVIEDELKYEKDESNIYELQKTLAKAKNEYEKRKRKESLEDEKDSIKDKISALQEGLKNEIKILEKEKEAAISTYEQEAEAKKVQLEIQKEAALKTLAEETKAGLEHLNQRRADLEAFYKEKLNKAKLNAQQEKELLKLTQKEMYEYLMLSEVLSNYEMAGEAHGKAYQGSFNRILDEIEARLRSLALVSGGSGGYGGSSYSAASFSSGVSSFGAGISDFAASAMNNAMEFSLNAVSNVQNTRNVNSSYDNRTATVNQSFNVTSGDVSPYEAKKAAKQALKLALG